MSRFFSAHATHPEPGMALALAAAQLQAQRASHDQAHPGAPFQPTLGIVYLTDHYAGQAEGLLAELQQRWPGVHWVGNVGVGVAASGVEYFDEPALVLMLGDLPARDFQVFNGRMPLDGDQAYTALVHADPNTPELTELITELAERTGSGYLFGGLAAARTRRLHIADGDVHEQINKDFAKNISAVDRAESELRTGPRTK